MFNGFLMVEVKVVPQTEYENTAFSTIVFKVII